MNLFTPLPLPNGTTIPNRIAKAAMEENMADADHAPSDALLRMYKTWAEGGSGLILTGNVMVDSRGMTGPNGVILENEKNLGRFRQWALAAQSGGGQVWMQINHPGRQMMAALGQETWSPSAVALDLGNLSSRFAVPKEMTVADIEELKHRFVRTSHLAEMAGFNGIQIHAAHGYMLSQFLSPITNKRQDQWGGSIENRARLIIDVVKAVRKVVAPQFSVSVKLNSADFQRGGFSSEDAKRVVEMLNDLQVDLVELSGGSYEAPAMQGEARDGRTLAREAYFLEFAKEISAVARMPLMVTGGIRRKVVAERVINSGVAMTGIATALAIAPNLPNDWRAGKDSTAALPAITWRNKVLVSVANMALVKYQMRRLSRGLAPNLNVSPLWAFLVSQIMASRQTKQYRRWMARRA